MLLSKLSIGSFKSKCRLTACKIDRIKDGIDSGPKRRWNENLKDDEEEEEEEEVGAV